VFTARHALIPYIKQITFRLQKVKYENSGGREAIFVFGANISGNFEHTNLFGAQQVLTIFISFPISAAIDKTLTTYVRSIAYRSCDTSTGYKKGVQCIFYLAAVYLVQVSTRVRQCDVMDLSK
jgi:hypothetical protein